MCFDPMALPYLTADIPGIGGVLRTTDDDFRVDEIPAYEPVGSGDHVFICIEKRGLTTPAAASRIAEAADVPVRDVGWAGMKDRHAVTRQYLSLPPPATPEAVRELDWDDLHIVSASRHRHKLRTGHLRGNRFVIRLRQTEVAAEVAAERASAVLAHLARSPGSPNWFGSQRFGAQGDNADIGRALVAGEPMPRGRSPRGRQKRMYVSALQAQLFNEYLRRRIVDGVYRQALAGDIMQKRDSGGLFVCDDVDTDQARLGAGDIAPTGPMYGHRLREPPPDSAARERETQVLADSGLSREDFARVGKLGVGTRRVIGVSIRDIAAITVAERAIEVSFTLPAGAYATAVLREVVKDMNATSR